MMPTTIRSPSEAPQTLLDTTLEHLVESGELTARQAQAVHAAYAAESCGVPASPVTSAQPRHPSPWANRLIEVGAYLGAALVAAGGAIVVGQRWQEIGQAGQLWLLAALAVVFGAAGATAVVVGGRRPDEHGQAVARRLASTLLTLCASAVAGLVIRAFIPDFGRDISESTAGWMLLTAAAVAGAVLILTRVVAPSALGELALFGTLLAAGFGAVLVAGVPDDPTVPVLVFFSLGAGYAVVALTTRLLTVPTLGVVLGLVTALAAAAGETATNRILLAVLALGCFGAYLMRPRWPLVMAAMLAAVALTFSLVGDALGSAVAFLASGLLLLGLAAAALIRQQHRTRMADPSVR